MCCHDPKLRVSASACVRIFEAFATDERATAQSAEPVHEPEVILSVYADGKLSRQWKEIQDDASKIDLSKVHQSVLRNIELIIARLEELPQPPRVLDEVGQLLNEVSCALKAAPQANRVLNLSSTRAKVDSIHALSQRVNAMKRLLCVDTENQDQEASDNINELHSEGVELFVSELSDQWTVLQRLETDEEREAFLACLGSEITRHSVKYSPDQLKIMKRAYDEIKGASVISADTGESDKPTHDWFQKVKKKWKRVLGKVDIDDCNATREALHRPGSTAMAPAWFVPWYELIVSEWDKLGEGGFGSVYRARWLDSEVVVKRVEYSTDDPDTSAAASGWSTFQSSIASIDTNHSKNSMTAHRKMRVETRKMFEHEVNVWFRLSHPHVVRLFGACHVGRPFFVCEFAPHGSLDKYLLKHPDKIWQKLHEAALGLQYLHERGIVHCDLKCNNIVVGSDFKAKVTDFGLSSAADTNEGHITGAWNWLAPELMLGKCAAPTKASDVWSFAMCIIEALRIVEAARVDPEDRKQLSARVPWQALDQSVAKYRLQRHQLPARPAPCTDTQWALVKKMTMFNPSDRIQICAAVDELADFAKAQIDSEPRGELTSTVSIGRSVDVAELLASGKTLAMAARKASSVSNRIVGISKLLWSRFDHVHRQVKTDSQSTKRLKVLVTDATMWATELVGCQDTLVKSTEMALRGYGLHRRLDKIMAAALIEIGSEENKRGGRGIHVWKMKCCELLGVDKAVAVQLLRSSCKHAAAVAESA